MDIAIIGMEGRFPGARTVAEFWKNLAAGVESIARFSPQEMRDAGVAPALLAHPDYVGAGGVVDDIEMFDAEFFGYTPREAAMIDPQQRVFLECAWAALENAGYAPARLQGRVGVFASVGMNTYLAPHLHSLQASGSLDPQELFLAFMSNDKDFIASRVSYKLNLRGPSVNVQTACSSSLVAVHLACQSLLLGECDLALAGGCTIRVPQRAGYLYIREGIESPDGHCRAFAAEASGTVFSNGAGVVVLARLPDAQANGDTIYAIIKGSAVNNDGARKVGYTAPSFDGQTQVVAEALAVAEVSPRSLAFIEAHGTGTTLGDAVEVQALTRAFGRQNQRGFCALGSVKTNVGHLDTAAGVTGLIKATVALHHCLLPASLHCQQPNPRLELERSPFFVNTTPLPLLPRDTPLRAGVSSFGIGGTNAHIVLEEAPHPVSAPARRIAQLCVLSTQTSETLTHAGTALALTLSTVPPPPLADAAYTLQMGREVFAHRAFTVAHDVAQTAAALSDTARLERAVVADVVRPLCFLFPGQGSQYLSMGGTLYEQEPVFTAMIDHAARVLHPLLGFDIRTRLYPPEQQKETQPHLLEQTALTQPLLFTVEYAIARLLGSWGIRPDLLLGHSVGEYVAACLAGIFSFEEGLRLVAARGRLMQALPAGDMVALDAPPDVVTRMLAPSVSLAVINGAKDCVVSGEPQAVQQCIETLTAMGYHHRPLRTSHAFHSAMMDPMLTSFAAELTRVRLQPPRLPVISNLTGAVLSPEQATDPRYWCRQLRETVQFAAALETVLAQPHVIGLEVGPGRTLIDLARRHPRKQPDQQLLATMRHPYEREEDTTFLLRTVGRLWLAGRTVAWEGLYPHQQRQRIALPTYPFRRVRHWLATRSLPQEHSPSQPRFDASAVVGAEIALPSWARYESRAITKSVSTGIWLLFTDTQHSLAALAAEIAQHGGIPIIVEALDRDTALTRVNARHFAINPADPMQYHTLLKGALLPGHTLDGIVYGWGLPATSGTRAAEHQVDATDAFHNLMSLLRALDARDLSTALSLAVLTNCLFDVTGDELLMPTQAFLLGLARCLPREFPYVRSLCVDLGPDGLTRETTTSRLLTDLLDAETPPLLAYRGAYAWTPTLIPLPHRTPTPETFVGAYLITGGLGHLGLESARVLVELVRGAPVHLYLTARSPFPASETWGSILQTTPPSDPTVRRIQQLQALEAAGALLTIRQLEVANAQGMKTLLRDIAARHGGVRGVIHAAGTINPQTFAPILELDPSHCAPHWQAKVDGLNAVARALEGVEVGFCLLFSSLSTLLGGVGYTAYAAANAYMDAWCRQQSHTRGTQWVSIAWDAWEDEGSTRTAFTTGPGFRPEEGRAVLRHLLRSRAMITGGEVVVARSRLWERWREWQTLARIARVSSRAASPLLGSLSQWEKVNHEEQPVRPGSELAHLWQRVLGVESVDPTANFFTQGGSSLLALQLLSHLRRELHVELSLYDFVSNPTFAALERVVTASEVTPETVEAETIPPTPRDRPLPLSVAQQQLWLIEQDEAARGAYHINEALHLSGPLNVEALTSAFQTIVARHEILRTRFVFQPHDQAPQQVIDPPGAAIVRIRSIPFSVDGNLEAALAPVAAVEFSRPFALDGEPPLRVSLLVLGPQDHVLLITVHHIVADDWSIGVLLDEFAELYDAFVTQRAPQVPALPIQYADYAAWQQDESHESKWRADLAYWKKELAPPQPAIALPVDYERQGPRTYRGGHVRVAMPNDLMTQVRTLGEHESASPFTVLLASFTCLLHAVSGAETIPVGTPVAGRDQAQLAPLIGYFINTVVLHARLAPTPTFRDALRQVRETTLAAHAHQDLPFAHLSAALSDEQGRAAAPLFRVWFTMLTHAVTRGFPRDLTVRVLPLGPRPARFDLALILEPDVDGLLGRLEYASDLFAPTTVQRLADDFRYVLDLVLTHPDITISDLADQVRRFDHHLRMQQANRLEEKQRSTLTVTRRRAYHS